MLGDNGGPTRCGSTPSDENIKKNDKPTRRGSAASNGNIKNKNDKKNDETKKRKHEVSSPTLVQKMKTRTDRQPSKVCISPYRLFETSSKGSHVGMLYCLLLFLVYPMHFYCSNFLFIF